jgi:signal peptidase II
VPNDADSASPAPDRTRAGRPVLATSIVVGIVLADQLTKLWAVRDLADGPVSILGDDVDLRLARNTGSAFSLFQGFTPLLAIVAVAVAFFLVRAVRRADDTLMVVALSMVLGGAVGNLVDRMLRAPGFMRGGVVDFVHLWSWPTFNVADASITIGAVLIAIWAIRADVRERHAERLGQQDGASGEETQRSRARRAGRRSGVDPTEGERREQDA